MKPWRKKKSSHRANSQKSSHQDDWMHSGQCMQLRSLQVDSYRSYYTPYSVSKILGYKILRYWDTQTWNWRLRHHPLGRGIVWWAKHHVVNNMAGELQLFPLYKFYQQHQQCNGLDFILIQTFLHNALDLCLSCLNSSHTINYERKCFHYSSL